MRRCSMVIELWLAFLSWLLRFGHFACRNRTRLDVLLLHLSQMIIGRAQSGSEVLTRSFVRLDVLLQQGDGHVHVLFGLRGWGVAILTSEISLFAKRTWGTLIAFLLPFAALFTCSRCTCWFLMLYFVRYSGMISCKSSIRDRKRRIAIVVMVRLDGRCKEVLGWGLLSRSGH
jgi:hypothetical protein